MSRRSPTTGGRRRAAAAGVACRNGGTPMKVEILRLEKTYANLKLRGTSTAAVNALRRTLGADVPKMAIEDVEFHLGTVQDEGGKEYESLSPMFDEILSHRLGQVPIPPGPAPSRA